MTALLLHHLLRLRRPAPPTTLRIDVCPPDVCPPRDGLWRTTRRWVTRADARQAPGLRTPLERARAEFVGATDGFATLESDDLVRRAQHARSMRELWHLRSELYTLIARCASQHEADARLARVNQHFPTRTQRSVINAVEMALVR
jgi:hypothetical protein